MIIGNHDTLSIDFYLNSGFEYVSKYPILLKGFFLLSHAPIYMSSNSPFYYIFGHVHGSEAFRTRTKNSLCVSVERTNYTPIECEEFNNYNKIPGEDNCDELD